MDRRSFLKLSGLVAAYIAVNSKLEVVETIVNALDRSQKVLIYLMQDAKGHWSVKASKNFEDPRLGIKEKKWKIETFKVLEYTNEVDADSKKRHWFDHYKCRGQYVPYNLTSIRKHNKICLQSKKDSGFYKSEKFYDTFIKSGAPAYMDKLRAEKGDQAVKDHMNYIKKFITPEGKISANKKGLAGLERYRKTDKFKEDVSKMGKIYGPINGAKKLKSFTPEEKIEYSRLGGLAGGAKKAIEKGTHNFLSCSPNKIKVICPDGHITSKPSAAVYCKNRGLNYSDCKVLNPVN